MTDAALEPVKRALVDLPGDARFEEPMSRHTSLKVGGPADIWWSPATIEALQTSLAVCHKHGVPVTPVGSGTNLLVKDGGIRGLVVSVAKLRHITRDDQNTVHAQAGVTTGKLLSTVLGWELGGLEFLGGVPGTVGGGLIMNAGTTLGEFTDVTTWVKSLRIADGTAIERDHAACGFVYRGSALPPNEIVVEARFALTPRPRAVMDAEIAALRTRRQSREPTGVKNAGSTFKNPPGDFAGRLIETAGLKGTRIGGALVSEVHANWLVNTGGATASELLCLMQNVKAHVLATHGIDLVPEWKIIGVDNDTHQP